MNGKRENFSNLLMLKILMNSTKFKIKKTIKRYLKFALKK